MEGVEFVSDAVGDQGLDKCLDELSDGLPVLVGHQSEGEFGVGGSGDNGFGSFALVSAPQSVDVEGRTDGSGFVVGVALFGVRRQSGVLLEGFGRGCAFCEESAFLGCEFNDVVVEVGDLDFSGVDVVDLVEDVCEECGGVEDGAAVYAGVEVASWSPDIQLEVGDSAEGYGDAGLVLRRDGGIGDKAYVNGWQGVFLEVGGKCG